MSQKTDAGVRRGRRELRREGSSSARGGSRGRALHLLPFVVGLVVLSAGVGLAVPRMSGRGGLGPTVVGVVAVAVGGAAAVWSVWRGLRSVRKRWWPLVLPGVVVVAFLALWTVGQGVAASFPARADLGARTPADVGLSATDVTLRPGHRELAAWWVPGSSGAAVVLLHGAGSTRTAVLDHAAVLGERGFGVLLIDARGHGQSDGPGMDFGWWGDQDVSAALDFLERQPGVGPDRLGLVGLSMGGEMAIGAAGSDPRVRAVIAEGATHRVAADRAYLSAFGVRGEIQQGIDEVTFAVADLLTAAPQPPPLHESVAAAQADGSPTPMLLVTAGAVETELLAAEYLEEAAPDAVEVWTVPGAGHTGGLRTAHDEWERRVVGHLESALGEARG